MEKIVAAPDIKVGDVVWQIEGREPSVVLAVSQFVSYQEQPMYRVSIGNSTGEAVSMELHAMNNITYKTLKEV